MESPLSALPTDLLLCIVQRDLHAIVKVRLLSKRLKSRLEPQWLSIKSSHRFTSTELLGCVTDMINDPKRHCITLTHCENNLSRNVHVRRNKRSFDFIVRDLTTEDRKIRRGMSEDMMFHVKKLHRERKQLIPRLKDMLPALRRRGVTCVDAAQIALAEMVLMIEQQAEIPLWRWLIEEAAALEYELQMDDQIPTEDIECVIRDQLKGVRCSVVEENEDPAKIHASLCQRSHSDYVAWGTLVYYTRICEIYAQTGVIPAALLITIPQRREVLARLIDANNQGLLGQHNPAHLTKVLADAKDVYV